VSFYINEEEYQDPIGWELIGEVVMVVPRLRAGSQDEENKKFRIYAHNIQGMPMGKDKGNKRLEFTERLRDQDMALILETGINEEKAYGLR